MPYISSNAVRQISDGSNQGTVLGRSAADPIAFYGGIPRTQPSGATSAVPITASTLSLSATQAGSTAGVGFSTAALFNAFLSTAAFLQADVGALATNLNALTQASAVLGLTTPADGALNVLSLAPVAWFRYGVGISTSTGVSQWADQSGNANHLNQTTGTNQPTLQADKSILCVAGSSHFLKCSAFTLNQPETVYILAKQTGWASGGSLYDGNVTAAGLLVQRSSSPQVALNTGADACLSPDWPVSSYAAVCAIFNGAGSLLQVNTKAPTAGSLTVGTNMSGFTLGGRGSGGTFGNVQVKEIIIFPVAHDAATRNSVIRYLGFVGAITV